MFNVLERVCPKFENYESFTKDDLNMIIDTICCVNVIFCRNEYWTKKLWLNDRAIKRHFKEYDEADIKNAFVIYKLYKIGIYGIPLGITWFRSCSKEQCEKFLTTRGYEIIFEDYEYWCDEQRAAEKENKE